MEKEAPRTLKEGWPRQKDVKIIIHGHAEYNPNDNSSLSDFDDFVNEIFNTYQSDLIELFRLKKGGISFKSSLDKFSFDSVEKQIR